MRFDLLTIFPEIFDSYLKESIIKRALESQKIKIVVHDIRKFSKDRHHKVDSTPYGGGAGMLMAPQPIYDCIEYVKKFNRGPVIFMSPRGKILNQQKVEQLAKIGLSKKNYPCKILQTAKLAEEKSSSLKSKSAKENGLILLCGRYEGIDQRIIDLAVDEELSIGKFVLTGGELAAMIVVDAVSRLVPGVLGDEASHEEESFSKALKRKKEYPHYTRPEVFKGLEVPEVLRSGHHAKIKKWREEKLS
jgi:tRNA (guanine37-N1)-methyltransferase